MRNKLPTILTLIRLIVSPLVLPFLLVYLLPYNSMPLNALLAGIFIVLSITDFFDGYLARRFGAESELGRILDPIADKFLVYSTLVALLAAHKINFIWVLILIGREFFVMGIRLVALEYKITVRVSLLGKIKTLFQMAYLSVVIFNSCTSLSTDCTMNRIELILLAVALLVSLFSAYLYYRSFMHSYKKLISEPKDGHDL